jgi:hypothetical protein
MEHRDMTIYFSEYWVKTAVEFWTAFTFPSLYFARNL